jgi:small subunit ribosomal protein S2
LHRNLDGIINMDRPPAAMFVIDILREQIAIHEAQRLGVPIVALVDTSCDPDQVTYPMAGNDDAIRAIKLVTAVVADAIAEAQGELGRKHPAPPAGGEVAASENVAPPDLIALSAEAPATEQAAASPV